MAGNAIGTLAVIRELVKTAQSLAGREVIFKEGTLLLHVRVIEVKADHHGVGFTFAVLDTPGFEVSPSMKARGKFVVSSGWESGTFETGWWRAYYSFWSIYFDQVLIERTLALAKEAAAVEKSIGVRNFTMLRNKYEKENSAFPFSAATDRD
jgi:hypothetical protein